MAEEKRPLTLPELAHWVRRQQLRLDIPELMLAMLIAMAGEEAITQETDWAEPELHSLYRALQRHLDAQGNEAGVQSVNHCLCEMVAQRLLLRVSNDFWQEAACYRLTPLGLQIANYFSHRTPVHQQQFSSQLGVMAATLEGIEQAAQASSEPQQWLEKVEAPLKYVVAELLDRIDHYQRHLDAQQQQVQETIATLLHQSWQVAIHRCQTLLAQTSQLFNDLQHSLEQAANRCQTVLLRIASRSSPEAVSAAVLPVAIGQFQEKLDRIVSWGQQTLDRWLGYDKQVHQFIQSAILLDQSRFLIKYIQKSLLELFEHPWGLFVAEESKVLVIREHAEWPESVEVVGQVPSPIEFEEASTFAIRSYPTGWPEEIEDLVCQVGPWLPRIRKGLTDKAACDHFRFLNLLIDHLFRTPSFNQSPPSQTPDWEPVSEFGGEILLDVIDEAYN